ncbi:MAG: zinc-binding dehydrogenase [Candidatus Tectomicrobia bacterium]|nr:zinc-binding dehydrogenase [Candidatus Tectomicrobia bacterium]
MKAAVYHGPRDIRVEDVSKPEIADNEMLVRVRACGICGSDLHLYRLGMFEVLGRQIENGRIMGHELSGEVVEIGSQVTGFQIGDRITGVGSGGFAEYVPVPVSERSPHPLPDGISFDTGATLEPLATSLHGVRLAQPAAGETVVILGVGIIGLGCVQAIRAMVDCRIIAVDASERRLEMAKQLGADATVNLTQMDPVEAVIELTGGAKPVERFGVRGGNADVVIDCAGAQSSPNQGLTMLKQQHGRLVFVALFERQPELDFNQVVRKHVAIHGSWTWTGEDYRQAIELVQSGKVDRNPLISHVCPLDEAPEAFAIQDQPDAAIKVLLKPEV